jgi:hypothetical protein
LSWHVKEAFSAPKGIWVRRDPAIYALEKKKGEKA